jgi:hypothetical protein
MQQHSGSDKDDYDDFLAGRPFWIAHLIFLSRKAVIRANALQRLADSDTTEYHSRYTTRTFACVGADPKRQFDRATALRIHAIEHRAGYAPSLPGFSTGARFGHRT